MSVIPQTSQICFLVILNGLQGVYRNYINEISSSKFFNVNKNVENKLFDCSAKNSPYIYAYIF